MDSLTKRAAIYTRISRDDSGEGVANQRQEADCRKLADLRGWEVVAVEADISKSGYSEKERPGWRRILSMIERGQIDLVVAWHMDRMTRSMLDLERLIILAEEHSVGISTVHGDIDLTSDVGRMVARILAAVARAEVERKGARQRRANLARAVDGEFRSTGFRPFGYTREGKVVEDEAALIRAAAEDVLNGTPLRGIVRRWNEAGVPTPRSQAVKASGRSDTNEDSTSSKPEDNRQPRWTHGSVRSVLLNPRNAAIATYRGEVVGKGTWDKILEEETHVLLTAMLTDPSRLKGDSQRALGNKPRNLLSGLATCAECGSKVEAGSSNGRRVYKCSNPDGDHLTTDREKADRIVRVSMTFAFGMTSAGTLAPSRDRSVPGDLWEAREKLNSRLETMTVSWANGTITDGMFNAGTEALKSQLDEIEERIEASVHEADPYSLSWEEARRFQDLDVWGQRRVLEDLAEIKLWPKYRKRNLPIKQQVTVYVTDTHGRTWAALDERKHMTPDPSAATYAALADALVQEQPEGVTTLASAAEWLSETGRTDRAPSGLPSKLSPLVRHVRGETRGAMGWTLKQ